LHHGLQIGLLFWRTPQKDIDGYHCEVVRGGALARGVYGRKDYSRLLIYNINIVLTFIVVFNSGNGTCDEGGPTKPTIICKSCVHVIFANSPLIYSSLKRITGFSIEPYATYFSVSFFPVIVVVLGVISPPTAPCMNQTCTLKWVGI
jgi:hypothetical protein